MKTLREENKTERRKEMATYYWTKLTLVEAPAESNLEEDRLVKVQGQILRDKETGELFAFIRQEN